MRVLSAQLKELRRRHRDEVGALREALAVAHGENLALRRKLAVSNRVIQIGRGYFNMNIKGDSTPSGADDTVVIEGFYDWGPGVVVTADCLGRSYQTALAGRQLIVMLPSFDGTTVAEPPLRYKRPDKWVDVDTPNPWGSTFLEQSRRWLTDTSHNLHQACADPVMGQACRGRRPKPGTTARRCTVALVGRVQLLGRSNHRSRPGKSQAIDVRSSRKPSTSGQVTQTAQCDRFQCCSTARYIPKSTP